MTYAVSATNSTRQNQMKRTKLAGSQSRSITRRRGGGSGTWRSRSGSKESGCRAGRRRSRCEKVSDSPVHQEVVKMRCVSERELRRPMWRSFFMRIRKAMATGMAMMMKVQHIQDVLWTVRNLVSGFRYMGIGTTVPTRAIRHTVTGKPRDWGHLDRGVSVR